MYSRSLIMNITVLELFSVGELCTGARRHSCSEEGRDSVTAEEQERTDRGRGNPGRAEEKAKKTFSGRDFHELLDR